MSRKALGRGLSSLFTQTSPLDEDLISLSIDVIDPTNTQPRQNFDEEKLEGLAQSIRLNGLIQPIVVRRKGDRFQIIAGERRWRAAQRAGLQKLPCIVKDIPEDRVLELSLIENIQREELNPIEEANAYSKLLEQLKISQEELARRIGKDRSTITNSMRLLRLPSEIKQLVESEKLSMGHARALLSVDSSDRQKNLATEIITRSLSVRETERLVKSDRNISVPRQETAQISGEMNGERANIQAAELRLSKRLDAPVKIKTMRKGGVIEIKFSSPEDLTRLFDLLIQRTGERFS